MNKIKSDREKKWKSLNEIDLEKYIDILIMMGVDIKLEYEMHWETHGMWNSNLIRNTLSRNKFEVISKYLTIGDIKESDKLSRIRPIFKFRYFINGDYVGDMRFILIFAGGEWVKKRNK